MNQTEVLDIAREAVIVLISVGAPVMLVSLGVGLVIALFQALTQIQEMTLTFVPKILAIFASLIIFLPYMLTTISEFTVRLADKIIAIN
ncbi:MAG: flagellar biosynthesis protein FliQ [Rhodospirillales bacterium]